MIIAMSCEYILSLISGKYNDIYILYINLYIYLLLKVDYTL